MKKGAEARKLVLYALVGLTSNAVALAVYVVLVDVAGLTPTVSMTAVYTVAAAIGFWGNRHLTFAHEGPVLSSMARYVITYAVGYVINFVILSVGVDRLGYSHIWTQAVAIVVVAAFLFLALERFVFPASTRAAVAAER